jgi:hypothetical protein
VSKIGQKFGISSLLAGMARQISGTICIRTAKIGPIVAAEHINDPDTASYLNLSVLNQEIVFLDINVNYDMIYSSKLIVKCFSV